VNLPGNLPCIFKQMELRVMSGYAYAVARVRALENRLLAPNRWERLTAAESAKEAWRVLSETTYSRWQENRSFYQYEEIFWDELRSTADLLRRMTKEGSFFHSYLLKYDMHNLKVYLLARITGFSGKRTPVSSYEGNKVWEIMKNPQRFKGDPFARAVIVLQEQELSDPQELQRAVDLLYYEYMAGRKKDFSPGLKDFWACLVDLVNLRTLLRVKVMKKEEDFLARFLLPGGYVPEKEFLPVLMWTMEEIKNWWYWRPTGRLAAGLENFYPLWRVEKAADELLAGRFETFRRRSFGEEPLFAYFRAKEQEVRKLRVILAAKINRLPAEEWKERI